MTIKYHNNLEQGGSEWLAARCGLLTASEMRHIISPVKLEPVKNPSHLYELLSQRVTGYVEPQFISDDMLLGMENEIVARDLYSRNYAEVIECGFITNDRYGFTLGYSPDGLVGDDGLIEIKSRRQKFQTETIISGEVPSDYIIQCQVGLMVSERHWLDFISFCAGMPMVKYRAYPDAHIQTKILQAATEFEEKIKNARLIYDLNSKSMITTVRTVSEELVI